MTFALSKSDLAQHYNFLHPYLKQLHIHNYSIASLQKVLHDLDNDIWKEIEDLDRERK